MQKAPVFRGFFMNRLRAHRIFVVFFPGEFAVHRTGARIAAFRMCGLRPHNPW
jgi:hypothetical protein